MYKKSLFFSLLCLTAITAKPFSLMPKLSSTDLGVDLGTQNTLVAVCNKDGSINVIANEPSFVSLDAKTHEVICIGQRAKDMYGKTPPHILSIRPMADGVIKDFGVTEVMLRYILNTAKDHTSGWLRGPRMIIGVPCSVTDPEARAIKEAALRNGAREVYTVMEPMAAAIGADLPVEQARGSMVIDIGGGTTDIVVISLKAPVVSRAVRVAGDAFDRDIVKYVHDKFALRIADATGEKIKKEIGAVYLPEGAQGKIMEVSGADIVTSEPRTVTMTTQDVIAATNSSVEKIINEVRTVLNETPVALAEDIARDGILLAGGGACFPGMKERLAKSFGAGDTKLKIIVPKNPLHAVVEGIGKITANFDYYKESLFSKKLGA